MKILITGGAGYIGSVLVEDLLKRKFSITVLDKFLYDETSLNHLYHYKNLNLIKGDVCDFSLIKSIIKNFDLIIPLAAYVGAPLCDLDKINSKKVNFDAMKMLFKSISKNQVIIMPTTNSAYGTGDKNNECTEKSALKPISTYAKEKVKVEKILMEHPNYISFRLATVFGMSPRMRMDLLVNDFVYKAIKEETLVIFEGNFKRNYIHVKDVSRAFMFAIDNYKNMKNQIYNVGLSSANISKLELAQTIKKYIKELVIISEEFKKDKDQRNYIVSNAKIESKGYKPSYSLDDGIKELIKGFSHLKKYPYGNV